MKEEDMVREKIGKNNGETVIILIYNNCTALMNYVYCGFISRRLH
jgi:hypothetical protein